MTKKKTILDAEKMKNLKQIALSETVSTIQKSLMEHKFYNIRQTVDFYEKIPNELGGLDDRAYDTKRRWMTEKLEE